MTVFICLFLVFFGFLRSRRRYSEVPPVNVVINLPDVAGTTASAVSKEIPVRRISAEEQERIQEEFRKIMKQEAVCR